MTEPLHFCHCSSYTFCEGSNLALKVYEKGIRPPPANDLDCAIGDVCQVESHRSPRAQGVCANLVGVEPQGVEANLCGGGAEKSCNLAAIDGAGDGVGVIGADGSIGGSIMTAEVEVSMCCGHHWITIWETSGLHRGGFSPDRVFLGVKE